MKKIVLAFVVIAASSIFAACVFAQTADSAEGAAKPAEDGKPTNPSPLARAGDPTTAEEAEKRLNQYITEIEERIDRPYLGPESLVAPWNVAATERDRVEIILQGKHARRMAVESKIAELTEMMQKQIDNDATLKSLQEIAATELQAAEKGSKANTIAPRSVPEIEISRLFSAAAEARVRVEERREAIMASAGGGAMAILNRELIMVSLDINEQAIMMSILRARVGNLRKARELSIEYVRLNALKSQLPSGRQK